MMCLALLALLVQAPTVLVDGDVVAVPGGSLDAGAFWVPVGDLPRVNGFTRKPEGLCKDELCVPIPDGARWFRDTGDGAMADATAIARQLDQPVVVDEDGDVVAFGAPRLTTGRGLAEGVAPDFTLPDRDGEPFTLSSLRGKKVLLLTWASW